MRLKAATSGPWKDIVLVSISSWPSSIAGDFMPRSREYLFQAFPRGGQMLLPYSTNNFSSSQASESVSMGRNCVFLNSAFLTLLTHCLTWLQLCKKFSWHLFWNTRRRGRDCFIPWPPWLIHFKVKYILRGKVSPFFCLLPPQSLYPIFPAELQESWMRVNHAFNPIANP